MARPKPVHTVGDPGILLHWAARVEDRFHRFRERRGRQAGALPTIVPYVGYGGDGKVRVLGRLLLTRRLKRDRGPGYRSVRGWRSFFSIPITSESAVRVNIGDRTETVHADRGGVIDAEFAIDLTPGWHTVRFEADGAEPVLAGVFVSAPDARIGILSDIDDTVMVTALPRPLLAAWNTFVLDEHARRAVTGMAVLYERLARQYTGGPFIYLSTGAWNVAPTLTRFLARNLYPAGALLLTDWGPTHDRLFRSGMLHKRTSLARLVEELPDTAWILIGDDGQHDEQIYGEFAKAHPGNVTAVCIRQLSPSEAVLAGGRSKAREHADETSVPWFYAPDGAGLAEQLEQAGLLPKAVVITEINDAPGIRPG